MTYLRRDSSKNKGFKIWKIKRNSIINERWRDSNTVPDIEGTNVRIVSDSNTTYNITGTIIVGTCDPNGNNKTPLPSVKGLDLMKIPLESGCDTSSDCNTCC